MSLRRRLLAEFIGTAGLLIVVVGSGIMGESLSQGNLAIALLANSIATGAGLFALIEMFKPISGAHFNPAVSLTELLRKKLSAGEFFGYTAVQCLGAWLGVLVTHYMFGQYIFQLSTKNRGDFRFVVSELIATFGLLLIISLVEKRKTESIALFITAAYWCTSSTSFANPAVTLARCFTNTFSGILWTGAFGFIAAQILGALIAYRAQSAIAVD